MQQIDPFSPGGFHALRSAAGISVTELANLVNVSARNAERWDRDQTPAPPTVIQILQWALAGNPPPDWPAPMTGPDLFEALVRLQIAPSEFAQLVDIDDETLERMMGDERGPSPPIRTLVRWMLAGYRPG